METGVNTEKLAIKTNLLGGMKWKWTLAYTVGAKWTDLFSGAHVITP